jgi:peptidoglycan-associated lipoprotein
MPQKRYHMVIFLALALLLGAYPQPVRAWDIALMKHAPQKTIIEIPESHQYMICDLCPPMNELHDERRHEEAWQTRFNLFQRPDTPKTAEHSSEGHSGFSQAESAISSSPRLSLRFSNKQDTGYRAGRQPDEESHPSTPGKADPEGAVAMIASSAAPPEVSNTPAAGPKQHESLLTVYFDFDSSDLKGGEKQKVEQAVRRLRAAEHIKVTGYTCDLGSPEYNIKLGLRRANSVARYLIELGIEEGRISKGSHGPCLDAVSDKGRPSLNRRAEITIEP